MARNAPGVRLGRRGGDLRAQAALACARTAAGGPCRLRERRCSANVDLWLGGSMRSVVLALAVVCAAGSVAPRAAALCFAQGPQLAEIVSTPDGLVFDLGRSRRAPALDPGDLLYLSWDLDNHPPTPPRGLAPITRIELVRPTGWRADRALRRAVDAENNDYWSRRQAYRARAEAGDDAATLAALDPGPQPTAPQSFAVYRLRVERTLYGEPRARFEFATQTIAALGRRLPIIAPRGRTADDRAELRERGILTEVSRSDECQYGYAFAIDRPFLFYWSDDVLVAAARLTPEAYAALHAPE